ncbi:hypothetical protein Tco_0744222 [Tanacetum coccineum]
MPMPRVPYEGGELQRFSPEKLEMEAHVSSLNYLRARERSFHWSAQPATMFKVFNGVQGVDRKISWVKWTKVLASKKYGGLGVSSFYALNRALLFRWVWRFLSHDNSLWFRFISAMHGSSFQIRSSFHCSNWLSIIREVSALKLQGIDFLSHCKRRVGSGMQTRFWEDLWLGEVPFNELFPRLYALENNKECSVAVKMQGEIDSSFRRHVRGGVETQQLENIQDLVRSKVLSNVDDRWAWDLNGVWGLFVLKMLVTLWTRFYFKKRMLLRDGLRLFLLRKIHPIFSFPVTWL